MPWYLVLMWFPTNTEAQKNMEWVLAVVCLLLCVGYKPFLCKWGYCSYTMSHQGPVKINPHLDMWFSKWMLFCDQKQLTLCTSFVIQVLQVWKEIQGLRVLKGTKDQKVLIGFEHFVTVVCCSEDDVMLMHAYDDRNFADALDGNKGTIPLIIWKYSQQIISWLYSRQKFLCSNSQRVSEGIAKF